MIVVQKEFPSTIEGQKEALAWKPEELTEEQRKNGCYSRTYGKGVFTEIVKVPETDDERSALWAHQIAYNN